MYFLELKLKFCCPELYTNTSKSHAGMSYTAVGPSFLEFDVLQPQTSIFTAEAYAVLSAMKDVNSLKL